MKILGIETSCDETALALIDAHGEFGRDFLYHILGDALISQASLHAEYGGVFPNLAKREHGRNLVPILAETLRKAGQLKDASTKADENMIAELKILLAREEELFSFLSDYLRAYAKPDIDALAVTVGPGLEPALWVGVNFARALARAWNLPVVAVNHMEGHIFVSLMRYENREKGKGTSEKEIAGDSSLIPIHYSLFPVHFPALALLVSGGHTELVLVKNWMEYEIIGATRDDAAGEAFDKTARLLGLGYPGGPEISKYAARAREKNLPRTFALPRPMLNGSAYEFSFAGLKTAVHKELSRHAEITEELKEEFAREIEDAIVEVLVKKTVNAAEHFSAKTLICSGGVSANTHLRSELVKGMQALDSSAKVLLPSAELSTDNGLMIALAGYFRAQKKEYVAPESMKAQGDLKLV